MPFSLSLSHLTHCKRSRSSNRFDSLRFQPYNFPMQFYSPAYFVLIRMFDDISKYFNKYKTHSTFLVLVTSVYFYLFIYLYIFFFVSLSTSQLKHGIRMLSRAHGDEVKMRKIDKSFYLAAKFRTEMAQMHIKYGDTCTFHRWNSIL